METKMNFRVLKNNKVGRFAVAASNLKPGQVIFEELPFVYGPKADTPPVCLGCCTPVDGTTTCTQCGWPVCGTECETRGAHNGAECQVFSGCKVRFQAVDDCTAPCPQYECITALRLLIAKEKDPDRWEKEVKQMEAHNSVRKTLPIWQFNQINIVDFLQKRCKLSDRFPEELIHTVCGIIEINAFEGRSSAGYAVRAIYPNLAIMSHNCIANTMHSVHPIEQNGKEFKVTVRSACSISEGSELFSSYTHSLNPTILRREHLKEGKYFDCDCPRCADPTELGTHMSSMKCQKCDPGLVTSTNPLDQSSVWKCSHCEYTARGETIRKVYITIQREIEMLDVTSIDSQSIEDRERVFRKYRSVLHPRHAFMTMLRHSLGQMYGRMEGYLLDDLPDILLERKVELCNDLLRNIDVIEPGYSRMRGMTLYELHAPLILLARNLHRNGLIDKEKLKQKLEEAMKVLEEASVILNLEPPSSPEGIIGQVASQSLQQLKDNFQDLIDKA